MSVNECYYIQQFQQSPRQTSLFQTQDYRQTRSHESLQGTIRQNFQEEAIDEQLLCRTSQLHQTLRNTKLLEFQLMQAKIMKKQNANISSIIIKQIQDLNQKTQQLQWHNESCKGEIYAFESQIQSIRNVNSEYLHKIQKENLKIAKNKQMLEKLNSSTFVRHHNKDIGKNNNYVSIQKIKLELENQSKEYAIGSIKQRIKQIRKNIQVKVNQNEQLQQQYQALLKIFQKREKQSEINKKKHTKNSLLINFTPNQHQSEIQHTHQYQIEKQNDQKIANKIESNEKKKSKNGQIKTKSNKNGLIEAQTKRRKQGNIQRCYSTTKKSQKHRII